MHVITSVRRKQDYEMSKDQNGKVKVEKVGTKEVTREGFEYELTLNLEFINDKHLVKASKDRTGLFMGEPEFVITIETGKKLLEWGQNGVDYESELKKCTTTEALGSYYKSMSAINQVKYKDLTLELKDKLTPKTEK